MITRKFYGIIVITFLVLLFAGMVSAQQTIVTGKIYNSDFNSPQANALVNASCNGNINSTVSQSDGTYVLLFDDNVCTSSSNVSISAVSGNMNGTGTGVVHLCSSSDAQCNNTDADISNFAVINFAISVPVQPTQNNGNSGSSGSSGGSYYGGGGGGGSIVILTNVTNIVNNSTNVTSVSNSNITNSTNANTLNQSENSTGRSITGGVIGATGAIAMWLIIFVVVVIIAIAIVLRSRNK